MTVSTVTLPESGSAGSRSIKNPGAITRHLPSDADMDIRGVITLACWLVLAAPAAGQDFYSVVNQIGRSVDPGRGRHCLTVDGDNVSVQPCTGADNQSWSYRQERLQPKGRQDKCLDMHSGFPTRNVSLYQCKTWGENNQKWYRDGDFVRTRDWDSCLNWQYNEGGKANGRGCDANWPSMKWTLETVVLAPITPAPPPPPVSGPPSFRPVVPQREGCTVVFVHGLRSASGMWVRTIEDGPLKGEQTSLQNVQKIGFKKLRAIDFSSNEGLDFNQQADELKARIDEWREQDGTRFVVLIGHSMGGVAALRYAQKYGHEGKTAGVITMDSPLLGSPSADLLEAVSGTGKALITAGAVACQFNEPHLCIAGVGTGIALDAGANLAGPVGSVAARALKPGSLEITELGSQLAQLEGTGIHVHSIVVGSDEKLTAGGIVSGDGVVPAYHQSVINLKDKYAPNARIAAQLSQSRQHQFDWAYSMTYTLEGRPGFGTGIFHNDAPHSPAVKANVDNTLASEPFCSRCGVVSCTRTIQTVPSVADTAPDNRAPPVVFDLKSGAESIVARKSSYEVPVSGLDGKIDSAQRNRFRLHGICYYPSASPAGKPETKPCGNATPDRIITDQSGRPTRLVFTIPDALRDPTVYQVQLAALLQTPYKTTDGKDVVVPSAPYIVPLQRTPRIVAPGTATQGDAVEVRVSGFGDKGNVALDLSNARGAKHRVAFVSTGAGGAGAFRLALPPGMPDDAYVISAEAGNLSASTQIRVTGNRRAPTLAHVLPVKPGKIRVPGYQPGDKVQVWGENWVTFGKFSAVLLGAPTAGATASAAGRNFELTDSRDACKDEWGQPKPGVCNAARGEIDQHWEFAVGVPAGRYRLRLSDGFSEASTQEFDFLPSFYIRAKSPSPIKAGQRIEIEWQGFRPNSSADVFLDDTKLTGRPLLLDFADPVVSVRLPDEITGRRVIRMVDTVGNEAQAPIEIAREQPVPQPAPKPVPAPVPVPDPKTKFCNPELPRVWQPGCVEAPPAPQPKVAPQPVPPPAPILVGPQPTPPTIIPTPPPTPAPPIAPTPPPKPAPAPQAPLCDPNRPRYAQPGCVEPPSSPPGASAPQKCSPNVPRYAQPGCIP